MRARLVAMTARAILPMLILPSCSRTGPKIEEADTVAHAGASAEVERARQVDPESARLIALRLPASDPGLIAVDTTLGEWRRLGPRNFGGKVYDIAVSAQSADTLYAAYGRGGVWRFSAAGASVLELTQTAGANRAWNQVAVWTGDDNTVVVGSGSLWNNSGIELSAKLLLSHDGGQTLHDITPPTAANNQFVQIAIDALDWRRIYALGDQNLFRSDDGGKTWRTLATLDTASIADNSDRWPDLAVNPARFDDVIIGQIGFGLRKSTDGGATWHGVGSQIVPNKVPSLAWSVSNPAVVWLETWSSASGQLHEIWRSTDFGENWTRRASLSAFTQGRYDMSLAVSPADPDIVIAANAGYHYSADAMQTSSSDYCCNHVDHSSVAFAPGNAQIVYVGADQGLFRSTSAGSAANGFARVDGTLLSSTHVFSFDVSSLAGQRLVLANAGDYTLNFLGNIDDAAVDWTTVPGYEYTTAAVNPLDPNLMFTVGGGQPIRRSVDRGANWESVEFLNPVAREYAAPVAFDPLDPAVVLVADRQIRRSSQRGAAGSWIAIGPPTTMTTNQNLRKVAIAPGNSQVIYASENFASQTVYFTTNGGSSWNWFDAGAPYILDLAVDPGDPSKSIVSGPFNLRYCSGFGANCIERRANLAPPADVRLKRVIFDRAIAGRIYAIAEQGGAFVSKDGGASWQRIGRLLPAYDSSELRLVDGRLYVSADQGVWELRADQYGQPATPAPAVAVVPSGGLRVSWNAVPGSASYFAQRGSTHVYSGMGTFFLDTDASAGAPSCYEVAAQNNRGSSRFSAPVCATAIPPNPELLFADGFD